MLVQACGFPHRLNHSDPLVNHSDPLGKVDAKCPHLGLPMKKGQIENGQLGRVWSSPPRCRFQGSSEPMTVALPGFEPILGRARVLLAHLEPRPDGPTLTCNFHNSQPGAQVHCFHPLEVEGGWSSPLAQTH